MYSNSRCSPISNTQCAAHLLLVNKLFLSCRILHYFIDFSFQSNRLAFSYRDNPLVTHKS
ncbi:hypothetical protein Hanom_Chr00s049647g01779281 [Helianthus anomalus]